MADGKWLPELTADAPLTEAARRALRARLCLVRDYLPLAVSAPRDPENVHQLRVGTRRGGAALRIFSVCLPDKTATKAKRRLRRIRQAAGDARDWDVFALGLLERLTEIPDREQAGMDYLLGYAAGQRAAAQGRLHQTSDVDGDAFETFIQHTLDAVQPPDKYTGPLLTLARPLVAQLLRELEEKANGDLNDYEHLHQVRIAGKKLRYAMELFAACFNDVFKEMLYPQIEEMQEILGRANDSHVAVQRLEAVRTQGRALLGAAWTKLQPGIAGLAQFHRRRLPKERRTFLDWWTQWQKVGGPALKALVACDGA